MNCADSQFLPKLLKNYSNFKTCKKTLLTPIQKSSPHANIAYQWFFSIFVLTKVYKLLGAGLLFLLLAYIIPGTTDVL